MSQAILSEQSLQRVQTVIGFVTQIMEEDYERWACDGLKKLKYFKLNNDRQKADRCKFLRRYMVSLCADLSGVEDKAVLYICEYFSLNKFNAKPKNYYLINLSFENSVKIADILSSYGGKCKLYANQIFNEYICDELGLGSRQSEGKFYRDRISEHINHLFRQDAASHNTNIQCRLAKCEALNRFESVVLPRLNIKYLKFIRDISLKEE